MLPLIALGVAIGGLAAVLSVMRRSVIKHVTSRYLGSLAPGFAATDLGYAVYVSLIGSVGVMLIGLGLAIVDVTGLVFFALAFLLFVVLSLLAIRGEVRVYRNLKR